LSQYGGWRHDPALFYVVVMTLDDSKLTDMAPIALEEVAALCHVRGVERSRSLADVRGRAVGMAGFGAASNPAERPPLRRIAEWLLMRKAGCRFWAVSCLSGVRRRIGKS